MGPPGEYSGALRGRCADLHTRRAQGTQDHYWTEALATVSKKFSTEGDRLGTSEVTCAATGGRCHSVAELIRLRLGKDLQQDVSEHYKRFLHRSARLYQQSMQHYGAEELNLHERALQAVKSVSTPGKDEPETKEIIADVLRGFLLLENVALTESEQVFVFGVAGKSFPYNHIANALRETRRNDDRLRSHDMALSQQLQGGHLVGGVHWRREEDDWQETDCDYEDSLEPWTSEWYGTDGYDDESYPEETDWTSMRPITIPTTAPSPITILHFWTKMSKHKKEIRANLRLYKMQSLQQTQLPT